MARKRTIFAAPLAVLVMVVACSDDDAKVAPTPDAGLRDDAGPDSSKDAAPPGLDCAFPLSPCGDDRCHNIDYDRKFCGACNRACGEVESCVEQRCTRTVFAIRKLFVGDTDRAGTADANAWKQYGANLDELVSTGAGTKECKPVAGASASSGIDGNSGIDNSWGANVLPLLQPLVPTPSSSAGTQIEAGGRTPLIAVGDMIGGDGSGTVIKASPVLSVFGFAEAMSAPKWDGTDVRHMAEEWTKDRRVSTVLDKGIYDEGLFVSSPSAAPARFDFLLGGLKFTVPIHALRVWFTLTSNDAGIPTGAVEGMLSGYILATELANAIGGAAGGVDPDLCSGSTLAALKTSVTQAADILSDGTQDPGKTCDAISIGLGFEAALVQLGDFAPKVAPAPAPCEQ